MIGYMENTKSPEISEHLPCPQTLGVHAASPLEQNFYLWHIFAQTNGPALWQSTWQNFLVYLRGTIHMNIPPRTEDGSFTYLRVWRKLWLLLGVNSLSHLKNRPKNLVPPALPDLYLFRFMIMSVLCSTICKSYNLGAFPKCEVRPSYHLI
jgi:hypothetical protein